MSLLGSEWTKLRSLRSTWLLILGTVVVSVALGVLGVSDLAGETASALPTGWDPTAESLKGLLLAQLLIGMLGALGATTEYGAGSIATSLAFVPSRSRLFAAKAAVLAAVALPLSLVTVLASFLAVQVVVRASGLPAAGIDAPGVAAALAGGTAYLSLIALTGLAIGILSRSTPASLAVLVSAALLIPAIGPSLPGLTGDWVGRYWPTSAGQAAFRVVPTDGMVAPWLGVSLLALTALVATLASHAALHVRDV